VNFPAHLLANEITRKQLWLNVFTAAVARLPANEAVAEANLALELCDARWKDASTIGTWQFRHNYPVGFDFPVTRSAG
jgi:hypothetical protein